MYALWFLCSDFVYCILFPQLVTALFDRRANRIGSAAGLAVALFLRVGGGEPVLGIPTLLPYPMVDDAGTVLFPFRTLAMVSGLVTILVVSRLTARWGAAEGAYERSMKSAQRSPIIMTVRHGLTPIIVGKTEASAMRRPSIPRTRSSGSTTASPSPAPPIRHVPAGW